MEKIMQLLQSSGANVKLEVSGEDLLAFANDLINRAKSETKCATERATLEKSWEKKS